MFFNFNNIIACIGKKIFKGEFMAEKGKNRVIVYSTTTCPFCDMVKDYLKAKSVEFTEYNVAEDKEKAKEMYSKSSQLGVPVVDINGTIIIGFDKPAIDHALGLN